MTARARDLLRQALELSAEERELLGQKLLESVEDAEPAAAVEAAWTEEIGRRVREVREETAKAMDGEEAIEDLLAAVNARRAQESIR